MLYGPNRHEEKRKTTEQIDVVIDVIDVVKEGVQRVV